MSLSSKSSSNSHHLQIKQQNKVSPARSLTYCCLTSLLMILQVDVAGVARGVCHNCTECPQFVSVPGHVLCAYCGCPPAKHLKTSLVRVRKRGSGRRQRKRQKWRPSVQVSAPPPRVARLVSGDHADMETQSLHSWNENDSSPNIYVKADDRLTFHRNPVYQTTDAIRGKAGEDGETGYNAGLHVWRVTWPHDFRGTHPVVGVATKDCHLTEPGYRRLVGSTTNSWGWCLKSLKVYHDSRKYRNGVPYPRDIDEKLKVPDSFYMILDMDRGTLAFQVNRQILKVRPF